MKDITFLYRLKKRLSHSTKGQNGRVLIIAGSQTYPGSSVLSSLAAVRSGSDLVYFFSFENSISLLADPDIIPVAAKGDFFTTKHIKEISSLLKKVDSVVVGPGIGENPSTKRFVVELMKKNPVATVIDADALKALSIKDIDDLKHVVLTPHKGEFKRLFDQDADIDSVRSKACFEKERVVVLKSKKDYITDGRHININTTGNAGMTIGGTGDVLAGLIGSFIAQGNSLYKSAKSATYILGKTCDRLKKKYGYNYTNKEIIELLPKMVKRLNS